GAPGTGWAAAARPRLRHGHRSPDSSSGPPAQAHYIVAVPEHEVGIGAVHHDRVALHRRVDDELVAVLPLPSEHGREVAAGEPGALAHADVGELAVVVHRGR